MGYGETKPELLPGKGGTVVEGGGAAMVMPWLAEMIASLTNISLSPRVFAVMADSTMMFSWGKPMARAGPLKSDTGPKPKKRENARSVLCRSSISALTSPSLWFF